MIPILPWLPGVGVCAVSGVGSRCRGLRGNGSKSYCQLKGKKGGLGLTSCVYSRWPGLFPVEAAFIIETFSLAPI